MGNLIQSSKIKNRISMKCLALCVLAIIAIANGQNEDWWSRVSARVSNNLLGGGRTTSTRSTWYFWRRRRRHFLSLTTAFSPLFFPLPRGVVFFVPGHTLQSDSFGLMCSHAMESNPANGPYAAVWDAGKRRWFRLRKTPNALQSEIPVEQLRRDRVKLFSIDFSDRFAGVEQKAREISTALSQIKAIVGAPVELSVVTHSAGDADFDTAAANGYVRVQEFRIRNRIAIGPVFDGTFMGNIGASLLPRLGRVGDRLGENAARELAENSNVVRWLQRSQPRLNQGVYAGARRVDILTEGKGRLSPRLETGVVGQGDGFVPSSQRRPFVSETIVVKVVDPTFLDHFSQPMYRGVIQQVDRILKR